MKRREEMKGRGEAKCGEETEGRGESGREKAEKNEMRQLKEKQQEKSIMRVAPKWSCIWYY